MWGPSSKKIFVCMLQKMFHHLLRLSSERMVLGQIPPGVGPLTSSRSPVWGKDWVQCGRREGARETALTQTEQPTAIGTKAKVNLSFKALYTFV